MPATMQRMRAITRKRRGRDMTDTSVSAPWLIRQVPERVFANFIPLPRRSAVRLGLCEKLESLDRSNWEAVTAWEGKGAGGNPRRHRAHARDDARRECCP